MRRQTSGATTVDAQKDQLQGILLKLQQMEFAIFALINEYMMDGQLDSTDPSGVFAGTGGLDFFPIPIYIYELGSPSSQLAQFS